VITFCPSDLQIYINRMVLDWAVGNETCPDAQDNFFFFFFFCPFLRYGKPVCGGLGLGVLGILSLSLERVISFFWLMGYCDTAFLF
jgi:hypothetical protein